MAGSPNMNKVKQYVLSFQIFNGINYQTRNLTPQSTPAVIVQLQLFTGSQNNTEYMYWGKWCSQHVSDQGNELLLLHDMKQHFLWKGHLLGWKYRLVLGLINPKEWEACLTSPEWACPRVCVHIQSLCVFEMTSLTVYMCVKECVGVSKFKFEVIWSKSRQSPFYTRNKETYWRQSLSCSFTPSFFQRRRRAWNDRLYTQ